MCRRENLTYTMTCVTCSTDGVKRVYWGETSRTLYQRGKEHWSDYLSESDKSSLFKHSSSAHPKSPPEWKIKVFNYHEKPLRRQVEEGILINNARGDELLNSKSEITRGGKIPRLVVMVGDKECGKFECPSQDVVEESELDYLNVTVRKPPAKTLQSKRQGEYGLKQTLIQPMLKKIKLVECVSKRKRDDPSAGEEKEIIRDGIDHKSESKDSSQKISESGILSQISNCNALEGNYTDVATRVDITTGNDVGQESEPKDPSRNISESGVLSQIPNCKALGTCMTNVGTKTGIGNTDVIGHESESKDPSQNNSEPGALSQIPNCIGK